MSSKLKVYELAKELSLDSQHLVDVIQRLGIDIKNPMSVLGTEEVRTVRDYYKKNRPMTKAAPPSATKSPVTEKRVGATVIRRRAAPDKKAEAPSEAPESVVEAEEIPADQTAAQSQGEETVEKEVSAPEQAPAVAQSSEPAAEPSKVPSKRKIFPSIIKKQATEEYLGEKVGAKPPVKEKKEALKTPLVAAKPGQPGAAGQTAVGAPGLPGVKRGIREIELAPTPEVAKEAKRRAMQRQDTVFKSADYLKRELVHSTKKKKNVINRPAMKTLLTTPAEHKRIVEMGETVVVSELAHQLGAKAAGVITKLMNMGVTATINQTVDYDTAVLVAHEFGYEVKQKMFKEEDFIPAMQAAPEDLEPRGPVVTVMGHVDHGKTSLLDSIRKTKVAAGEAGGITQHVGAYSVVLPKGKITFLDTPGHEAFTAMRARGAKVTDIVILVVSAVDGVMPQTLESVNHAKAASVPIIVAVNKTDLPDGNPDRIKQTLAGHGLNPEEWGGDTIYVNVSAKTGKGIDQLLENVLLQAEILELKANFKTAARGTVIESKLDKSRGAIATVLVQHGKLKPGDLVVCGTTFGKIRAMSNSASQRMTEALPSDPVEILGLPEVPNVGDELFAVADEKTARTVTGARTDKQKEKAAESRPKASLEEMMAAAPAGETKELRIILKSDVQGSAEALREALSKLPQEKVKIKILHIGTGGITESDVMLASASRAVILGFNIRPDVKAQKVAESERIEIRTYTIIYDLLEEMKKLLEGLLDKEIKEKIIGRAEVRNVFHVPKVGTIAGSAVIDGKVQRGCFLRLLRDSRVIYEGKISSLKRFKDDVREVASGFECGIGLEGFNDLKLGDQFEAYIKEEHKGILS